MRVQVQSKVSENLYTGNHYYLFHRPRARLVFEVYFFIFKIITFTLSMIFYLGWYMATIGIVL